MFGSRSSSITAVPRATASALRSMPTNSLPGSPSAIGMRLPPSPAPISSTRQAAGGAGAIPNRVAWVASLSGCVCSYA